MAWTLAQLAEHCSLSCDGNGDTIISGVCSLNQGRAGALAFLADPKYRAQLADTQAGAVVLRARDRALFSGPALISTDPALSFAQIAILFDGARRFEPAIHPSASVHASAVIGLGGGVGPNAVIEADVQIGAGTYIGPGCVVREGATIGPGGRLEGQVYVGRNVRIGARVHIQPGAVIGGRGFGLVPSAKGWIEVPQVGSVIIGDDVEVGANTCIDRGAIDDTVVEDGVKLDNLIQIAHNCRIGAGTAIAGCAGIAGSTTIGRRCMIGGAATISGHLKIADGVVVLGFAMVTKSLTEPGVYGSGIPVMPARDWRRLIGRVRRLGLMDERIASIEQHLGIQSEVGQSALGQSKLGEHEREPDDT